MAYLTFSPTAPDPKMKLFGVMLTTLVVVGALVGGVVGVLLPKISTGISLGVLISLFLGVVRNLPLSSMKVTNHTYVVTSSIVFFTFPDYLRHQWRKRSSLCNFIDCYSGRLSGWSNFLDSKI